MRVGSIEVKACRGSLGHGRRFSGDLNTEAQHSLGRRFNRGLSEEKVQKGLEKEVQWRCKQGTGSIDTEK